MLKKIKFIIKRALYNYITSYETDRVLKKVETEFGTEYVITDPEF